MRLARGLLLGCGLLVWPSAWANPNLAELLRGLESDQAEVRSDAAERLGEGGRASVSAVAALSRALRDPAYTVQERAGEALARIGSPAVAYLVRLLDDPDPQVRCKAILTLERLGPRARPALAALIRALRDPEPQVRRAAVEALGASASARPEVVHALVEALRDEKQGIRKSALDALGALQADCAESVDGAVLALDDRAGSVRRAAALNLAGWRSCPTRMVIPRLWAKLEDPLPIVRLVSLGALMRFPEELSEHHDRIRLLLQDPSPDVRGLAAALLAFSGEWSRDRLPLLRAGLKSAYSDVQMCCALAMAALREATDEARPALWMMLRSDEPAWPRKLVLFSLILHARTSDPPPILFEYLLKSQDPEVRQAASILLANLGEEPGQFKSLLNQALEAKNPSVRAHAALWLIWPELRRSGNDAWPGLEPAAGVLAQALPSTSDELLALGMMTLALHPLECEANPLAGTEAGERDAALEKLASASLLVAWRCPQPPNSLALLGGALDGGDPHARLLAAEALLLDGAPEFARSARTALKAGAESDVDPRFRRVARLVLQSSD